jgi:hypothetical protein
MKINILTTILLVLIFNSCDKKIETNIENLKKDTISINYNLNNNKSKNKSKTEVSYVKLDSNKYKGKIYRELKEIDFFKSYSDAGGAMIESYNGKDYCISHFYKNKKHLIVLNQILKLDEQKVKYLALDMIEISGISKNTYLSFGSCRKNKNADSEIIAVHVNEDEEYFNKILIAWRADRKKSMIYEIKSENIDCTNDGYGV